MRIFVNVPSRLHTKARNNRFFTVILVISGIRCTLPRIGSIDLLSYFWIIRVDVDFVEREWLERRDT